MQVKTRRFGEIEVQAHQRLRLPGGVPPFADEWYVLLHAAEEAPFAWLQSLEQPELAFVVLPSEEAGGAPQGALGSSAREMVELGPQEVALVLYLVVLGDGRESSTVNLLAPIVINPRLNLGRQVVRDGGLELLAAPLQQVPLAA